MNHYKAYFKQIVSVFMLCMVVCLLLFSCKKENNVNPVSSFSAVSYGKLSVNINQDATPSSKSKSTFSSVSTPLAQLATQFELSYSNSSGTLQTVTGTVVTLTQVVSGVTTTVMIMQALAIPVGTYTLTAYTLLDANHKVVGRASQDSPFVSKKIPVGFAIQSNVVTTISVEILPTEDLGNTEGGGVQLTDIQMCAFWVSSTFSCTYEVAKYIPQESIINGRSVTVYVKVKSYATATVGINPVKFVIPYDAGTANIGLRAIYSDGNYVHANSAFISLTADLSTKNGTQLNPVWLSGL